jgi:hypothetical protein
MKTEPEVKTEVEPENGLSAQNRVVMPFKVGDLIIYDAIGKGVYEVVAMGDTFFDVKCKRLFEGSKLYRYGMDCAGHVTNINRGGEMINYQNIKCKVVKAA